MKKIILVISVLIAVLGVQFAIPSKASAQTAFVGTTTNPTAYASDATSDTLKLVLSGVFADYIKVQSKLQKVSGTIAGTVRLYGSMYDSVGCYHAVGDTLTLANQTTNDHAWTLTGGDASWKYLLIIQSGGTTMKGRLAAVGYAPRRP